MPTKAVKYFLIIDDRRHGPFREEELVQSGMRLASWIWFKGCEDWVQAREVPRLVELLRHAPGWQSSKATSFPFFQSELNTRYFLGRRTYRAGLFLIVLATCLSYVGLIVDAFIPTGAGHDPNMQAVQSGALAGAVGAGAIGVLFLAAGWFVLLAFLHRAWSLIQDGRARTSPGAAIGLLFVPVFNCFWAFVAFGGLAKDLNQYRSRRRLQAPPASEALGFAVSLYYFLGLVPFLGLVTLVLNLFLFPRFIRSIYETMVAMDDAEPGAVAEPDSAGATMATFLAPIGLGLFAAGMIFTTLTWMESIYLRRHHAGAVMPARIYTWLAIWAIGSLLSGLALLLARSSSRSPEEK